MEMSQLVGILSSPYASNTDGSYGHILVDLAYTYSGLTQRLHTLSKAIRKLGIDINAALRELQVMRDQKAEIVKIQRRDVDMKVMWVKVQLAAHEQA